MTKRIKSQKSFKTSLPIQLEFTKTKEKQTLKKNEDALTALQPNEQLDKIALTGPEISLKRHNQPQLMSHTEGQKTHQGLHLYKDERRDLSDPHLHLLHQNQHKITKHLHHPTDKGETKTETLMETDTQGTKGTTEAKVAPEPI